MSDFLRCLAGMLAVVAPFGALATQRASSERAASPWVAAGAAASAFVILSGSAALNRPLLDWLNVSPESFQFAAGAAMAPLAVRLILAGDSMPSTGRLPRYAWAVPLAVPLLAGPSSIISAVSYAARFGEGETIAASALATAFTGLLLAAPGVFDRVPLVVVRTLARLSGGLLLLIAVELAVDGVHSV